MQQHKHLLPHCYICKEGMCKAYPFEPQLSRSLVLCTCKPLDNLAPPQPPPCELCFLPKIVVSNLLEWLRTIQSTFGLTFCTTMIISRRTLPQTTLATNKPTPDKPPFGDHAPRMQQACSGRAPR